MSESKLYTHMTLDERLQADGSSFAISVINAFLREAHARQASDLHIDPGSDFLTARFRVDGDLRDGHCLPMFQHSEIIARLKVLANLRTDEHQLPQDGRFIFQITPLEQIDVRVSIVPTHHGENAVLRLLSSRSNLQTFTALGLTPIQESMVRLAATRPQGMILVTGPTGSGKTSTLYSLIHLLNSRHTSIITIEDPVEYTIPGINQISAQLGSGLSFATGLRSILRQDPNIIGVGEIRDSETASIAANAALTGHLVLSTLHTSNAPTALPRLLDMGVEEYVLSSTLSLVISQRLVRRLCQGCRVKKPLLKRQRDILTRLSPQLSNSLEETHRYVSRGCSKCKGSGVRGRTGIFEVMNIDSEIRRAIEKRSSAHELQSLATKQGMTSLFEAGLDKANQGLVDLEEVFGLAHI